MTNESATAPTVLIVEDDDVLASLVSRLLERNGMNPSIARDGAEAIERLAAKTYDAIALDLMMPRIDGFGVIEWIRLHTPQQLQHVIVMTATTDTQLARLPVSDLGGLIRKPFEIHELGRLIRTRALGESEDEERAAPVTRATVFDAM
jgi:DNA-binding response OmpR family regulator